MSLQAPHGTAPAPADAVLVALAARGLAGSMFDLPTEPFGPDQWFALVRSCQAHGLVGMLALAAQRGDVSLSQAQAEELVVLEAEAAGLALLVEQRVVRLSALLAAAGVAHRLVGAPARAHLGYRQPGIRTFDLATVLVEPSGLEVSAPWRVNVQRAVRAMAGRSIDIGLLAEPPTMLRLAGHDVPTASLEEHLVLACLEVAPAVSGDGAGVTVDPRQLVSQRDIAELALCKDIDAARVQQIAETWGAVNPVARALAQVWMLFGLADRTRLSVWARRIANPPAPPQRPAEPPPRPVVRRRSSVVRRVVRRVNKLTPSNVVARAAARRSDQR